jgi:hypothetical protein
VLGFSREPEPKESHTHSITYAHTDTHAHTHHIHTCTYAEVYQYLAHVMWTQVGHKLHRGA